MKYRFLFSLDAYGNIQEQWVCIQEKRRFLITDYDEMRWHSHRDGFPSERYHEERRAFKKSITDAHLASAHELYGRSEKSSK